MTSKSLIVLLAAVALVAVTDAAIGKTIYVDGAAGPGGNGSPAKPVQTIQDGIELLGSNGGTVLIRPGVYIGPIVVDREDVVLRGDTTPTYDANGFLAGFTDEVIVTIDRQLRLGVFTGEVEDFIEIRGSDNQVHNLVVVAPPRFNNLDATAISAKAEDGDFYDNVLFSHVIVHGEIGSAGWSRKSNARYEYITALDGGFVGINPNGNGEVEVHRADLANWTLAGVCFLGLWEYPFTENGPSVLNGTLTDSRISGSGQYGLLLAGQGGLTNPHEASTVTVAATGNRFSLNDIAIGMRPAMDFTGFQRNTAPRVLDLYAADNAFDGNGSDSEAYFRTYKPSGPYVYLSTVTVDDNDDVFPATADTGAPVFANSHTRH